MPHVAMDRHAHVNPFLYQEQCLFQGVVILVLIGECIAFWRIRKLSYSKILAWGYILPLSCALIVLPFEELLKNTVYLFLLKENLLLFWFLIVLAHASFVRLLQKAYYPKQSQSIDVGDFDDVMDELL